VVIMEVLALHRPVVSTYVAGIPELVQTAFAAGRSGRSVPALADAMADVLRASANNWPLGELRSGRTSATQRGDGSAELGG
jgi:hypothetical protein